MLRQAKIKGGRVVIEDAVAQARELAQQHYEDRADSQKRRFARRWQREGW